MKIRRIVFPLLGCGVLVASVLIVIDHWVTKAASSALYSHVGEIRFHRTALVLGCSEYLRDGRLNRYFLHRVNTAAELFHAEKCHYLIVSGDHGRPDYNEPAAMKKALMNRGVPAECIIEDFAGFRTLDSVIRARDVFLQNELIVVSQRFHNERAIFIANHHGIEVAGLSAESVSLASQVRTRLRESLARTRMAADLFILDKRPRFLGEQVPVP